MQHLPGSKLVDVRTRAEWDYVGRIPNRFDRVEYLPGRPAQTQPSSGNCRLRLQRAMHRSCILAARARDPPRAQAATQAGYSNSYISSKDSKGTRTTHGHRNTVEAGDLPACPGYRVGAFLASL